MIRHQLFHGEIIHARVEAVYPTIAPGSVTLCHVDGPYGMGKAAWDKVRDLAAWYRPHIVEWGRVCAPSASVYLWNTAEGWAAIHPEMVGAGWTFRALVTWDKGIGFLAGKIDTEATRTWPDVTEVCGFYQREGIEAPNITEIAGADDRNWIRGWMNQERERAGIPLHRLKQLINDYGGAGEMLVRHSFYESQWCMPTSEQWHILHRVWNEHGDPTGRPYLQRPRADGVAAIGAIKSGYQHLRAEYEAMRAPFVLPSGVTNVWSHPLVGGAERLTGDDGATLHPCQKPLLFARRIVEASSRPGDLVFEPFGGTCRIAAACEAIGRYEPEKARRYVCVEMDEDGRGYIPAVLASLRGDLPRGANRAQVQLFGGAA